MRLFLLASLFFSLNANAYIPTSQGWIPPVASASDLPVSGADNGDACTAQDTNAIYSYNSGSNSWLLVASPAAENAVTALTGDIHASGPGAVVSTIQPNVVTNADLAQAPADTIKGNNTGSTANEQDLTVSQVFTLLGLGTAATHAATDFQSALGFTPENVANKATDLSTDDNTHYPTTEAVVNAIAAIATPTPASTPFYQFIESNGSTQTQRSNLNFSTNFTTTDSSANNSTTIDIGTVALNHGGTGNNGSSQSYSANQCIFVDPTASFLENDGVTGSCAWDFTHHFLSINGAGNGRINSTATGTESAYTGFCTGSANCVSIQNQSGFTENLTNAANSSTAGASIGLAFSRGTLASRLQSLAGDQLGGFIAQGYNGSSFGPGYSGGIVVAATENTTSSANGGEVVVTATANGTLSPSVVETLATTGISSINQTITAPSTSTVGLKVKSGGSSPSVNTLDVESSGGTSIFGIKDVTNNTQIYFEGGLWAHNGGSNTNSFIGPSCGTASMTGTSNAAVGSSSFSSLTSGSYNTGIGLYSGYYNTTGANNTYVGYEAGVYNAGDSNNACVGYNSCYGYGGTINTSAAVGANALYGANSTTTGNSALGFDAGYGALNSSASDDIFLGTHAGYSGTSLSNTLFIGNNSTGSNAYAINNIYIYSATTQTNGPIFNGSYQFASHLYANADLEINGATTVTNAPLVVNGGHIAYQGTAPVATVNANAGTGATCSVTQGQDGAFNLSLVTTSTAPASGAQCSVAFNKAFASNAVCSDSKKSSAAAVAEVTDGIYFSTSTTNLVVNFTNADVTGNTFAWDFVCH